MVAYTDFAIGLSSDRRLGTTRLARSSTMTLVDSDLVPACMIRMMTHKTVYLTHNHSTRGTWAEQSIWYTFHDDSRGENDIPKLAAQGEIERA